MKKRILFMLALPLLFMFLSSFGLPQEIPRNDSEEDKTVVVQFMPAQIEVNDQRNLDYLKEAFNVSALSTTRVAVALESLSETAVTLIENQERREGLSMAYIRSVTQWDEERIIAAINSKNQFEFALTLTLGIIILVGTIVLIITMSGDIIDLRRLLYNTAILVALGTASFYITKAFAVSLSGYHDFLYLEELLYLSG